MDIYVLFLRDANNLMESKKLELPFQQVIKVDGIMPDMEPLIHIDVGNVRYDNMGDNQLRVNIQLLTNVSGDISDNINSINKLEISDEAVPNMPSVIVYYVQPGDTLWKIAKKYRNKVDIIKEFNNLKEDTIYPGQRLLIPKLEMSHVSTSLM